jgi:hypothetical protein
MNFSQEVCCYFIPKAARMEVWRLDAYILTIIFPIYIPSKYLFDPA